MVDVAFCESFMAASVDIDFSKYPPPSPSARSTRSALSNGAWLTARFGDGVPISIPGWKAGRLTGDTAIPSDWERVDFTFYNENGGWVGAELSVQPRRCFARMGVDRGIQHQQAALQSQAFSPRGRVSSLWPRPSRMRDLALRDAKTPVSRGLSGGSDRRRSGDLSIFSRTLYQLSYRALATLTGLEPATSAVTGRRANQLRYRAKILSCNAA